MKKRRGKKWGKIIYLYLWSGSPRGTLPKLIYGTLSLKPKA
jgi:hypothetical protein